MEEALKRKKNPKTTNTKTSHTKTKNKHKIKTNLGAKGVSSCFLDGPEFIRWGYLKAMWMPSHTQPVSITVYLLKESWTKDARSWGGDLTPVLSHGSSYALYQMGSYNKNTHFMLSLHLKSYHPKSIFFNLHIYKVGTGKIFKPSRHPVSSQEEVSFPVAETDTWGGKG